MTLLADTAQHPPTHRREATRGDLRVAARCLAVLTLVGAAAGVLVVGVLGRLAMAWLAFLNPEAHHIRSDDGFLIGQFTLSGSLQLALAGLQLGLTGVFLYVVVRGLLVGPAWFRLASISLGPAVVICALLVSPHGVDFTRLHPVGLSVALFTALPAVFVAVLHLGAERWLPRSEGLPVPLVWLGLLPWVVLFPLTLLLLAGRATLRGLRRLPAGRRLVEHPAPAWLLRAGLAVLFGLAVADLVQDLSVLT